MNAFSEAGRNARMSLFPWLKSWFGPKRRQTAHSAELARRMAAIRAAAAQPDRPKDAVKAPAPSADALRAAIRKGFNASQPVTSSAQLHGRREQVELLVEGVLDRGNHALIYGARGSGKTSLARVFANAADNRGYVVLYSACEPEQDLGQLMTPYLEAIAGCKVNLPADRPVNPRDVTEMLALHARRNFILILDEFDRVNEPSVQHDISRLMKMLSDAAITVQIVAVGIASGLGHVLEGHASLRRHMSVIPITRIESQAVFDIIAKGARSIGMDFTDASREMIAHLACGSPYHVRLFCALACFEAIKRQEKMVDLHATLAGVARAVNDWALTNADDAALFRKVIAMNPTHWDMIETVARTVATHGSMPFRVGDAILDQLEAALMADATQDHIVFKDSLAPQFLLAMIFASENSDKIDENIVSINDLHRQSVAQ
jgi:MoxR-like ATPase